MTSGSINIQVEGIRPRSFYAVEKGLQIARNIVSERYEALNNIDREFRGIDPVDCLFPLPLVVGSGGFLKSQERCFVGGDSKGKKQRTDDGFARSLRVGQIRSAFHLNFKPVKAFFHFLHDFCSWFRVATATVTEGEDSVERSSRSNGDTA